MSDDLGPWAPLTPAEVAELLAPLTVPWWIAGGIAIDLWLGRTIREHHDIDVEVLRRDELAVRSPLRHWDLHLASDGVLTPWAPHTSVPLGTGDIWCRETSSGPWLMQLMLNPGDDTTWVSKRDASLVRPMARAVLRTADGIPYLAPELQLLMKAKTVRPHDELDFVQVAPVLADEPRAWLVDALQHLHPGHSWIARLRE